MTATRPRPAWRGTPSGSCGSAAGRTNTIGTALRRHWFLLTVLIIFAGVSVQYTSKALKDRSAINLDHVQTVERTRLVTFVGTLNASKMQLVCRALAVATGCAD